MSGILFILDVIAFLVVAFWAYANDRSSADISAKGLLGMKGGGEAPTDTPARSGPKWKRSQPASAASGAAPELAGDVRSEPRWRRSLKRRSKA